MNLQELKEHGKKIAQDKRVINGMLKIREAKDVLRIYNANIKNLSHETVVEATTKIILEQKVVLDNLLNTQE